MTRHYRLIAMVCAVFGWLIPSFSYATDAPAPSAEALFYEGVALLENRHFTAACPKFEQSLALERRPATLFALADCKAQSGQAVRAIEIYKEYLQACAELPEDKKQKLASRMQEAGAQIEALRPMVSGVTVVVQAARGIGFSVVLGDRKLETKGTEVEVFPLEPGDQLGVVEVAGAMPTQFTVTLAKGEHRRLEVLVMVPQSTPGNAKVVQPAGSRGSAPPADWIKYNAVIAGGLGVLGLGAVIGANAAHPSDEQRKTLSYSDLHFRESMKVGFAFGAVASFIGATAVGGLTLKYALTQENQAREEVEGLPMATVRVAPTLGGVVVQGNWF